MIYEFIYQNPPKATRSAKITVAVCPKDLSIIMKAAYRAKYGTDMVADGYTGYLMGTDEEKGDPGTDADGGAKGPKPSIVDFISWGGKVIDEETKFYDGDEDPTLFQAVNGRYRKRDEGDEVTNPDHYNQGKIDVIEGLYQMLPFEQFRGFMKGNIIKYTVRYEHKGHGKDLDKVEEYKRRLKEYERKEKML